uniref:BRCT domain-containing protein n=1 Tax=Percolomonas cosmopolitus TaxID=63605 RepID=A0A7S1KU67_9EUKA
MSDIDAPTSDLDDNIQDSDLDIASEHNSSDDEKTSTKDTKSNGKNFSKGKPAKPFKHVVGLPDVSSSEDTNAVDTLTKKVTELGGRMNKNKSGKITHFILHTSNKTSFDWAKGKDVIMVTPQWVIDCHKKQTKLDESDYVPALVNETVADKKEKQKARKATPVKHDSDAAKKKTKKRKRKEDNSDEEDENPKKKSKFAAPRGASDAESDKKDDKKKKTTSTKKKTSSKKKEDVDSKKKDDDKEKATTKKKPATKKKKEDADSTKKETKNKTPAKKKTPKKKRDDNSDEEPESELDIENISENNWEGTLVRSPRRAPPRETAYTIEFSSVEMEEEEEDRNEKLIRQVDLKRKIKGGIKLGESPFEGDRFTHLVLGDEDKRTPKVLFAIAYGATVVTTEWWKKFVEYLEENEDEKKMEMLDTTPYEVERWMAPVEASRSLKEDLVESSPKEAKDEGKKLLLEGKCISFHHCEENTPLLERLVEVLGGRHTRAHRRADVCVVNTKGSPNETCLKAKTVVSTKWLSDSIEQFKVLPFKKYVVKESDITVRKHEKKDADKKEGSSIKKATATKKAATKKDEKKETAGTTKKTSTRKIGEKKNTATTKKKVEMQSATRKKPVSKKDAAEMEDTTDNESMMEDDE